MYQDTEQRNLTEIEMLNQRGGRMLSIVDLIRAGTITPEAAGYALWRIAHGASFLTGAVPGGAGKTTLLADLLGMLPPGEAIVTTPDAGAVTEALATPERRGRCYLCHEIGAGQWYGYLWGPTVGRFFELQDHGGRIAACLHADDPWQTRDILTSPTLGVSPERFGEVGLLLFMAVERGAAGTLRRVSGIWSADGRGGHELIFDRDAGSGELRQVRAGPGADDGGTPTAAACRELIERLVAGGVFLFEEVRQAVVAFYAEAREP